MGDTAGPGHTDEQPAADPPAAGGVAPVATWHARSGRLTARKRWALLELAERFAPQLHAELFAHRGRVVLEIGAGTGEAALALAEAHPDWLVIAAEVHRASVARMLLDLDDRGLGNVRVVAGDGRTTLAAAAVQAPGALRLLRVFFPDPWPKRRHHGRRLVDARFAALAADALAPGGALELATDDSHYAAAMRRTVGGEHRLQALSALGRADRPCTYYEARALEAGRAVHDLRFRRVTPSEESIRT